jgi:hypothetical protein
MQAIEIDFFRPEDAPGVAGLFQQVYGDGYPIKTYYTPDKLIEENAAGRILSTVARTPTGEVIGHDALVMMDPDTRLYENAAGAVLSAFRGQGVFFRVMKHSITEAAKRFGVEEIFGEPVCNHLQLQKMCAQLDYKESGLEIDLMPSAAYTKEKSASARVSVLMGYFLQKTASRTVYLPPVYQDQLEYLYSGMGVERIFGETKEGLPDEVVSRGKIDLYDFAQVARIAIYRIGSDFDSFIGQQEARALEKGTEVFQIWLPLSSPHAAAATDIIRRSGYFIGGLLTSCFGGDGLLMQKTLCETDWEGIALYSARAKRIAEIVKTDQRNVGAE